MKGLFRFYRYVFIVLLLLVISGDAFLNNAWAGAQHPGQPSSIVAPSTDKDGTFSISWTGTRMAEWYEIRTGGRSYKAYGTSKSFKALPDGKYRHEVRACSDARHIADTCGPYTVGGTTTVQRTPGKPKSLTVPATDTDGKFKLSWGTASGTSKKYYLYESKNGAGYKKVYSGTGRSITLKSRGDATYKYRVRACNPIGGCGSYRNGNRSLKVLHTPGMPGVIAEPVGIVQLDSYHISWAKASGSVSYYQYRKSTNNGVSYGKWESTGTTKRVDFNSSQSGYEGEHKYQVQACNSLSCSSSRTSNNILVYQLPGRPSSITVPSSAVGSGYTVTWAAGSGKVTNYKIKQEYNGVWGTVTNTGTTRSKHYMMSVGGRIRNLVQACNPAGCSSDRVSSYYTVLTNSIGHELEPGKLGYEMDRANVGHASINSFNISYRYILDPFDPREPTEFLIQQSFNGSSYYDIAIAGTDGFTVSGLAVGNYKFRVQGYGVSGFNSNIVYTGTVTVHAVPPTPSAFEAPIVISPTPRLSCNTNDYTVNWPDTSGANQYQLEMRHADSAVTDLSINESSWNGGWVKIHEGEAINASTFIHEDLIKGANHQYRVRARYKLGHLDIHTEWSDWRESGKVRRPHCIPEAPFRVTGTTEAQYANSTDSSILTHLDRDGHFRIEWRYRDAVQNKLVGYYEVQRYGTKVSPHPSGDRLLDRNFEVNEAIGGIYRYNVVACNVDGCSNPSDYLEVTVALPAEPPSLPAPFDFIADPDVHATATAYEGNLSGNLSVTPSGAAIYSLPVAMPPGTGGIAPKLSLDYSSQSGNGLLGAGWSLGGLSMITRCPKTLAQDQELNPVNRSVKYDTNDRFCLDGKRLVVVEGEYGKANSVYRTEMDSFDIVTAKGTKGNGPAWFEVQAKSGEVLQYGNTNDSQVEATGKTTVAIWALNRVEDTVSNYYTIDYYEGAGAREGEFYPTAFHYTGNVNEGLNPYETVSLVYESRPDKRTAYHMGSKNVQAKRLKKIETAIGEYQLKYAVENDFQASRVNAIQYCDATNNCPDTRRLSFDWQENNGQEGWGAGQQAGVPPYDFVDGNGNQTHAQMVDIDGDGHVEVVGHMLGNYVAMLDYKGSTIFVPSGLGIMSSQGIVDAAWEAYPGSIPSTGFPVTTHYKVESTDGQTIDSGLRFVDLNNDGFVDVLQGRGGYLKAWLHGEQRGDGWTHSSAYASPEPFVSDDGKDSGTRLLDLNGDGLPDILRMQATSVIDGHFRVWLNTGSGWESANGWAVSNQSIATLEGYDRGARFADLNGDGLVDMLLWYSRADGSTNQSTYLNTGTGWMPVESVGMFPSIGKIFSDHIGRDQGLRLVDLNGDGLTDLVNYNNAWLNTGQEWIEATEYGSPLRFVRVNYETYADSGARLLDINGDGLVDIIQRGVTNDFSDSGRAFLNTGDGWNGIDIIGYRPKEEIVTVQSLTPDNSYDARDAGVRFADINSDGQVDFVGDKVYFNQAKASMITHITDGLGNIHTIRYKPLTDPDVYALEDNSQGKHQRDARMAMQVVYQVDIPDGRGDPQTQEYFYKGLMFNVQGLGSHGFRQIKQTDLTNHYNTVTTYHQKYPYVGIPKSSISKTDTGVTITETHTNISGLGYKNPMGKTHGFIVDDDVHDGVNNGEKTYVPVFPYIKHTETITHHLNNAMGAIGTSVKTTTDTLYDNSYGNATKVTVTVDDQQGGTWTTVTENDYGLGGAEHERMGLIAHSLVTKTVAGETSQREMSFDYHDTSHLLTKETVEPNQAEPNTLVTVYGHDGFGNRTSVTVCAKQVDTCAVDSTGPTELPHRTTKTSYDPATSPGASSERGRYRMSTTNALGHSETFHYNTNLGVVTKHTGSNGLSTCYEYDTWGRKTKKTGLCGSTIQTKPVTVTGYHQASHFTEHAAYTVSSYIEGKEHGTTTRSYFDSLGRKLRNQKRGFKGQMIYVDHDYDNRGRERKVSEPYFYSQDYVPVIYWNETNVIDELGRVQETIQPVGDISYDPDNGDLAGNPEPPVHLYTTYNGFETRQTDVKGRIKVIYKNAIGQTTKTIDAYQTLDQSEITYGYDSQGKLQTTTDSAGNIVGLGYDVHGRKVWMKDPDMGKHVGSQWTYSYNGYGELSEQTDAKGQMTHMEYDGLGRMITRTDLYGTADAQSSYWVYDTASGAGIGKLHTETGEYANKTHVYDEYGRLVSTTQNLTTLEETGSFTTEWRYDELGRRTHVQYPEIDANTPRVWMYYQYNEFGYLHYMLDITDDPAGVVYWRADEVNMRGQLEDERLRNRTRNQQYFNEANGWMDATFTLDGTTSDMDVPIEDNLIQHTHYQYDVAGNIQTKTGRSNGLDNFQTDLTEHYTYDDLNRLTSSGISGYDAETSEPFGIGEKENYPARTYQYDALGNITHKDGVGDYYYGSACENGSAGPHAVCGIRSGNIIMKSYQYDANGNMTHSYIGSSLNDTPTPERTITYTGFNKPSEIIDHSRVIGGTSARFYYGPNRSRVLRIADEIKYDDLNNEIAQRERIAYIGHGAQGGTIMERKTNEQTGKATYIHFMYAGGYHNGQAFAMRVIEQQDNVGVYVGTEYYHRDHLGSVIAITDDTGLKRAYDESNQETGGAHAFLKGYDAWGKRRNPNWSEAVPGQNAESQYTSTRGHLSYTGQEAITGVGLIHMNGRVYDPELGRFLSADPFIQSGGFSQSYNRYSYVWNNPINSIDPSGYISLRNILRPFKNIMRGIFRSIGPKASKWAVSLGSIFCGPAYSACVAAGNYDIARAFGADTRTAYRGAVSSGILAFVSGPPKSINILQISAGLVDPKIGRIVNFLGNGFEPGRSTNALRNLAHEVKNQYISNKLVRFAERRGMTLQELNALLTLNSFLGNKLVGSRYHEKDGQVEMSGFTSRGKGTRGLIGVLWDVNDTILGYQGLLDASAYEYITGNYSGQHISSCHSLGTLTCNNLVAGGYAPSAQLNALPFGNIATSENISTTNLGKWDLVNGGWLGRILNLGARSTPCEDAGASGAFCHGWDANYRPHSP